MGYTSVDAVEGVPTERVPTLMEWFMALIRVQKLEVPTCHLDFAFHTFRA